jgi:ankyrin repeat protein
MKMENLFQSVERQDYGSVKADLQNGGNPNIKDRNGWTPMYYAFLKKDQPMVQLLKKYGAKIEAFNEEGFSMLSSAVLSGEESVVRFMLKNKVDANQPNFDGKVPLYFAVVRDTYHEDVSLTQALLKRGADPNAMNLTGTSPLHLATYSGNAELVKVLLNHGANPNLANDKLETPIFGACRIDNKEMIFHLIKHNAQIEYPNREGKRPLEYCSNENKALFSFLHLSLGQAQDSLIDALKKENPDKLALKLLVLKITQRGKNPQNMIYTREDDLGLDLTPLQTAILNTTDTQIYQIILKGNPKSIDVSDPVYGWTALHMAAMHQKPEAMKFLVREGANFHILDKSSNFLGTFDHYIRDEETRQEMHALCKERSCLSKQFCRSVGRGFSQIQGQWSTLIDSPIGMMIRESF